MDFRKVTPDTINYIEISCYLRVRVPPWYHYRGNGSKDQWCVAKENTVRFWFQRFRSGDFEQQNKPHGRPDVQDSNEELKAIVEADPSQT
jgi:hypothetical protein